MRITSNVPQKAEGYLKQLLKQVDEAAYRSLSKTGIETEAKAKGIIEKEAYDTGELLRSVTSVIYRSPNLLRLVTLATSPHAIFVELGRKPGKFPNLDALTKWVGRKMREQGINTRVNVTYDQLKEMARSGGKKATTAQKAYRQQLAMIYLVGRKIATRGIREKLIFRRLQQEMLEFFRMDLLKELQSIR
jgi:hypothetical protein